MVSIEDHIAITQVLNLYGHVVDYREWDRMKEIFAPDAVFDGSAMGGERMAGVDAIVASFSDAASSHPLAHHSTNVVIWQDAEGTTRSQSKGFGPRPDPADSRTVTYHDVLRRTPEGWRIAERRVFLMVPRPNN
jgi:hypothetical protein